MVGRADAQVLGPGGLVADSQASVQQLRGLLSDARGTLQGVDKVLVEALAIAKNTRVATADLGRAARRGGGQPAQGAEPGQRGQPPLAAGPRHRAQAAMKCRPTALRTAGPGSPGHGPGFGAGLGAGLGRLQQPAAHARLAAQCPRGTAAGIGRAVVRQRPGGAGRVLDRTGRNRPHRTTWPHGPRRADALRRPGGQPATGTLRRL